MRDKICILILSILLASCNLSHEKLFKEDSENYTLLKNNIYQRLLKAHSYDKDLVDDDFAIQINKIVSKKKNIGVYSYSEIGSHSYGGNFFTYDEDGITLIKTSDKNEKVNEIKLFLEKYEFGKKDTKKCLETVIRILENSGGNSF